MLVKYMLTIEKGQPHHKYAFVTANHESMGCFLIKQVEIWLKKWLFGITVPLRLKNGGGLTKERTKG